MLSFGHPVQSTKDVTGLNMHGGEKQSLACSNKIIKWSGAQEIINQPRTAQEYG